MRRRFVIAALLVVAAFSGGVPPVAETSAASMCTCVSPKRPTCEVWWQTSAIFSGRVTRIETISEEVDGETRTKRLVSMRVQDRWRGLQAQRDVVIATGAGGGDCGFRFENNRTYLVYANQAARSGRYETGICSRTALIEDAETDLLYLRGIESATPEVSLYGMVYRERQGIPAGSDPDRRLDPGGPLAEIEITLTDPVGTVHQVTSDGDGWYELDGLPAGRYELTLAGKGIDTTSRWRMRIPVAPACIWRNIIVDPLPFESNANQHPAAADG